MNNHPEKFAKLASKHHLNVKNPQFLHSKTNFQPEIDKITRPCTTQRTRIVASLPCNTQILTAESQEEPGNCATTHTTEWEARILTLEPSRLYSITTVLGKDFGMEIVANPSGWVCDPDGVISVSSGCTKIFTDQLLRVVMSQKKINSPIKCHLCYQKS